MRSPELEDDSVHAFHDEGVPERVATSLTKNRSHVTDGDVGGSSVRRPLVAVTARQRRVLVEVLVFYKRHGRWPSAVELAAKSDVTAPIVWSELKTLACLGYVNWSEERRPVVRVRRFPDGIFFVPKCGAETRVSSPVAPVFWAPNQRVAT